MTQEPNLSVYSQGQHLSNLSRLLYSLRKAQIFHVLLEPKGNSQKADGNSVIKILFSEAGLEKFYHVFVGQRFICLGIDKHPLFWDTRTGLTLEIHLPQDPNTHLAQYRLVDPSIPDEIH